MLTATAHTPLRILFAADLFTRGYRHAEKIASASGLSTREIYLLCETPAWDAALRVCGYEGDTTKPKGYGRWKRRQRKLDQYDLIEEDRDRLKREDRLPDDFATAERLWQSMIKDAADLFPTMKAVSHE